MGQNFPQAKTPSAAEVISLLLPKCLAASLAARHGAVLALAELVLASSLRRPGGTEPLLPSDVLVEITTLVPRIDKARLYRGRGGYVKLAPDLFSPSYKASYYLLCFSPALIYCPSSCQRIVPPSVVLASGEHGPRPPAHGHKDTDPIGRASQRKSEATTRNGATCRRQCLATIHIHLFFFFR